MKNVVILVSGLIVGSVAGAFLADWCVSDRHALAELKLTQAQLAQNSATMSPQLREYLKCRLYMSICEVRYRTDFFSGPLAEVDFGPVDSTILAGVSAIKGPESPDALYRIALARVGRNRANQRLQGTPANTASSSTESEARRP